MVCHPAGASTIVHKDAVAPSIGSTSFSNHSWTETRLIAVTLDVKVLDAGLARKDTGLFES